MSVEIKPGAYIVIYRRLQDLVLFPIRKQISATHWSNLMTVIEEDNLIFSIKSYPCFYIVRHVHIYSPGGSSFILAVTA